MEFVSLIVALAGRVAPLLFMQHFRGGMDHWDPAVTDGFARQRPIILFDNAGVAGSSGTTRHYQGDGRLRAAFRSLRSGSVSETKAQGAVKP